MAPQGGGLRRRHEGQGAACVRPPTTSLYFPHIPLSLSLSLTILFHSLSSFSSQNPQASPETLHYSQTLNSLLLPETALHGFLSLSQHSPSLSLGPLFQTQQSASSSRASLAPKYSLFLSHHSLSPSRASLSPSAAAPSLSFPHNTPVFSPVTHSSSLPLSLTAAPSLTRPSLSTVALSLTATFLSPMTPLSLTTLFLSLRF